ncbi:MAG: hypothetical protein WBW33_26240 [Bryobacteraceae bacterium]
MAEISFQLNGQKQAIDAIPQVMLRQGAGLSRPQIGGDARCAM